MSEDEILAVYDVRITVRRTEYSGDVKPPPNSDVASVCELAVENLIGSSRAGKMAAAKASSERVDK